jgi:cysteine desulfurase/selenocysteine lyase
MPRQVALAIDSIIANEYANIHRGVHFLSSQLTGRFEAVREQVKDFLGASALEEIIFTSGTTAAVNLVSKAWGEKFVAKGDLVAVTSLEHHSNFVAWQSLAIEKGARFEILEANESGEIDLPALDQLLAKKPKILAITALSNVMGSILDLKEIATRANAKGVRVFVDGAQAIPHLNRKIADFGPIDFLAFSAHKMCGPTGVGVLWGRRELLEEMNPYQFGGDMIADVGDRVTTWNKLPWKLEAGTPNITGVLGLGAAISYIEKLGRERLEVWEQALSRYAVQKLIEVPGMKIYGPKLGKERGGLVAFSVDGLHPHDLGSFLDSEGIAIRVGHHCAQPLHRRLGVEGTCRASFYFYNTHAEIDRLAETIQRARKMFQ